MHQRMTSLEAAQTEQLALLQDQAAAVAGMQACMERMLSAMSHQAAGTGDASAANQPMLAATPPVPEPARVSSSRLAPSPLQPPPIVAALGSDADDVTEVDEAFGTTPTVVEELPDATSDDDGDKSTEEADKVVAAAMRTVN